MAEDVNLPKLPDGQRWWVLDVRRRNNKGTYTFRVFAAATGCKEADARANYNVSDRNLDKALMETAIRKGEVLDEFDWEPVTTLLELVRVDQVGTELCIANRDGDLLAMLKEHHFFLDEFADNNFLVVGGSVHFS